MSDAIKRQLDDDSPYIFTTAAGLRTGPVPEMPYRSREFFERERSRVFGRSWLVAGRVEQVPKPGDYFLRDVAACNASIIIVRGKIGEIRAFHNVCSHRGSQVISNKRGSAPVLMCKYHNWTYSTEGNLIGVPDERFFDIDKKKCGLTPINIDFWAGWIFINLEAAPSVGLRDFLGGFADYLDDLPFPFAASTPIVFETDVKCNWKVGMDAFSESYHIPALHNKTLKPFVSSDNPHGRLLDAKFFGPHRTGSMYGDPNYAPDPKRQYVEQLAYSGAAPGGSSEGVTDPELAKLSIFLAHPSTNPTKTKSWSMDANCIFPNFKIDTGRMGFWTHQFWPLSANEMHYESRFYFPTAKSARQRFQQEYWMATTIEVLLEDLANMEGTQRGLDSGAKQFMQLQDHEVLIRHSIHHIMKWVDAPTVAEAMAS